MINESHKRVLIADDEYMITELFRRTIERGGGEVSGVVHSAREAISSVEKNPPDIVLLDIAMENRTAGIDACKRIRAMELPCKIYFLSSYKENILEKDLMDVEYDGYIDKFDFQSRLNEVLTA